MSRLTREAYELLVLPESVAISYLEVRKQEYLKATGELPYDPKDMLHCIKFAALIQFDCDSENELLAILKVKLSFTKK